VKSKEKKEISRLSTAMDKKRRKTFHLKSRFASANGSCLHFARHLLSQSSFSFGNFILLLRKLKNTLLPGERSVLH
jgi:hypothetical protein